MFSVFGKMPKGRILIVDNCAVTVEAVEKTLRSEGYEVIISLDGVDGLKKAYIEFPDLIILDLVLPILDGFEVCHSLKRSERCKDTPIIIATEREELTGEGEERIGAADYIRKPFTKEELVKKVETVLSESK